jgi:hypothetical protein
MSRPALANRAEAHRALSNIFARSPQRAAVVEVREDKCFHAESWLALGTIALHPGSPTREENLLDPIDSAVRYGFYEWHVPTVEQLGIDILSVSDPAITGEKAIKHQQKMLKTMDGLVHLAQRIGLRHPTFDAGGVSKMPFARPTTVVGDTNSILQGALDFVVRFLGPTARVKIPAIAQMEILVWVDNYFKLRRDGKKVGTAVSTVLHDHMRGQGAQRTLLRLELMTDVEVERTRLGADPLRGIVQPDSDQEHKNLDLKSVQRNFADRLIFETAIQHRHLAPPGHSVVLLTSDQGLARMSLAEGLDVLFYEAAHLADIAGATLPGTQFNPFTGQIYSVALADLGWELAVGFGGCRFRIENGESVEISALGEKLSWKPYHAKEDLLWVISGLHDPGLVADADPLSEDGVPLETIGKTPQPPASTQSSPRQLNPSYKFSTKVMLRLIQHLASGGVHSNEEVMRLLGFTHERKLAEYRGFLVSGGFVSYSKGTIEKTDKMDPLLSALKNRDHEMLAPLLLQVDSLRLLLETIRLSPPLRWTPTSSSAVPLPIKADAFPTYRCLLELGALALEIPGEGVYPTETRPQPFEFAGIALRVYEGLTRRDDPYVATGAWLEQLAREYGIHPLIARNRLEEARAAGHLERYVEGSTPDTRFTGHTFCMLDLVNGELTVREVALYEGNYLLPGKGSVSLRLKKGAG